MNLKNPIVLLLTVILTGGIFTNQLEASEWQDTVKMYGDMRYRVENILDENNAGVWSARDRQRVRARIGVKATLDDYWMSDFRVATDESGLTGGNGDPVSTNQTLGDLETRKPLWIDLAYIEYKIFFSNGKLTAGKMNNPFVCAGKSQLVWDGDLSPEGAAGNFNMDLMPDVSVFLNTAGFWLKEAKASYDPMIYGSQVGARTKIADAKLSAGFGYFIYTDVTNQYAYDYAAANTATAKSYGNTLKNGKYANNYMLGEGFLDFDFTFMEFPIKFYVDYVLNNGANQFNRAYLAGLVFNKTKVEGSWEVGYSFRQVQKDAVVGQFCDSDFIGGGTNGEGHQITAAYILVEGVKASLTFFRTRKNLDTTVNPFYNRFQADVVLSF